MCEADLCPLVQVVIFKGDFACLQAINLTNSTTGDLVFMDGTKFLPVWLSPRQMVGQKGIFFTPLPQVCSNVTFRAIFFWKASLMSSKVTILLLKSCNFLDRPKEDDAPASKVEL